MVTVLYMDCMTMLHIGRYGLYLRDSRDTVLNRLNY